MPWLSDDVSSGSNPDVFKLSDSQKLSYCSSIFRLFIHEFKKFASVPLALLSLRDLTIYIVFISLHEVVFDVNLDTFTQLRSRIDRLSQAFVRSSPWFLLTA